MPKWVKDLERIAEDALHTAVSPVEGPANQIAKDIKDVYTVGKDVFSTPDKSSKASSSQSAKRSNVKRKFAGDPPSGKTPSIRRRINTGMSKINAAGTASSVDEVPVIRPPKNIAKSHPDYFTIDLPFYWTHEITITNGTPVKSVSVRLNSPYDPIQDAAPARGAHQPLGRDTWGGIYDFYRVLSSDTNVTWTYQTGLFGSNKTANTPYQVANHPHHILCGYHITDDVTKTPSTVEAFVEAKHTKVSQLHPRNMALISSTAESATVPSNPDRLYLTGGHINQSFHYAPEQWDYHVTGVGLEEQWTPKDANPAFNHFMNFTVAYPYNDAVLGEFRNDDSITVRMDVYQKYTVQWREVGSVVKNAMDTDQS